MIQELETFLRDDNGSYVLYDTALVQYQLRNNSSRDGIVKRLDCRVCGTPAGKPCECANRGVR